MAEAHGLAVNPRSMPDCIFFGDCSARVSKTVVNDSEAVHDDGHGNETTTTRPLRSVSRREGYPAPDAVGAVGRAGVEGEQGQPQLAQTAVVGWAEQEENAIVARNPPVGRLAGSLVTRTARSNGWRNQLARRTIRCHAALPLDSVRVLERRQVFDVPTMRFDMIEHRTLAVACSCGPHHESVFPAKVGETVQYGPNVRARCPQ